MVATAADGVFGGAVVGVVTSAGAAAFSPEPEADSEADDDDADASILSTATAIASSYAASTAPKSSSWAFWGRRSAIKRWRR